MPTATTSAAGRAVQENATARRARLQAESAATKRADVTTPIGESPAPFAAETLPDPPLFADPPVETRPAKSARTFSISTVVAYRGREITIAATGMTLDEFCDLMDDRNYASPAPPAQLAAPIATADDLPDGYKLCRKHGAPMKPRSKQGDVWNSHNVGTTDNPCWCKGYRGPDSPGYEVE